MRIRHLILAVALLGGSWLVWRLFPQPNPEAEKAEPMPVEVTERASSFAVESAPAGDDGKVGTMWRTQLRDLEALCARLEQVQDPLQVRFWLERMARQLESGSSKEAVAAVQELLKSGRDARTGLPFEVGDRGGLSSWPSYRCWLLDLLSRLDLEAASAEADRVLARHGSADEWALALRDRARTVRGAADTEYLKTKVRELIRDPRWRKEQTSGWLESFDAVVHLQDTQLTAELAGLAGAPSSDGRAAAHAAALTLDRLVQSAPVDVLGRLLPESGLLKGPIRAGYFARADIRDPGQRQILERYILDPELDPAERARFFGIYPNAHFAVSRNLLTSGTGVREGEQRERDRAALAVVKGWLSEERFGAVRPGLEEVRARLELFVGSAERQGARRETE